MASCWLNKTICWPHNSGLTGVCYAQELQLAGINFKAFDLGGHEIARRVWKDYYAKVSIDTVYVMLKLPCLLLSSLHRQAGWHIATASNNSLAASL